MLSIFFLNGVTSVLLVFLLGVPHRAQSQTPAELDQRLQALNRELEGTEKRIEEFSQLVAKERSRLPSESVLLDQYLFLQSQVQELEAKVEQLQGQPRAAAQGVTSGATPPQPEEKKLLTLLSALLLPIFVVLLYDRLFNARRFPPLEERIEHVEDYAYGKEKEEGDPFKET